MKKAIMAISILFVLTSMTVMVSAETTVETNWDGSGDLNIDFVSGNDARSRFWTGGSQISGSYKGTDYNNNPYNYGVDTTRVQIKAEVTNGGHIEHLYNRTDSKTSMYGPAGQSSYSFITTDAQASFASSIRSNYADMIISNYKFQNNNQFTATGNHLMTHRILTGTGMGAEWYISANGTSSVTQMSDEARASGFKFGEGAGCYTNANVNIAGSGTYDLHAWAPNQIKTQSGITTDGYLHIGASFTSGFNFGNFALRGN